MKCLPLLSILTTLALVPTAASAFYAESRAMDEMGDPVPIAYDTETPVEFRIDAAGMPRGDGSEVDSIAAAFATWAAVDCVTIDFEQGERTVDPEPRHWMMWAPDSPDFQRYIAVYWTDDPEQFPTASVGYFDWAHDGTGKLIGGQIILNSLHHDWSTTGEAGLLDVQSVVTAMLGRVLGITSATEGNATYPSYSAGNIDKRTLGEDDIAGITYIYGDESCEMRGMPEGICEGTPLEMCPPTPDTGDAGTGTRDGSTGGDTGTSTSDGGTGSDSGGGDAGTGGDGGASGDGDGGCSVGELDAESTPGWLALLLFVGLALIRKRRA